MGSKNKKKKSKGNLTRRQFLGVSGSLIAGASLPARALCASEPVNTEESKVNKIQKNRILGRTGFPVSDICMGCGHVKESNLVRYAYDKGINYFDTSEIYGQGASEASIGKAMPFMDRKKIFVTTKLGLNKEDTEQTILDRFGKCQERLNTPYVDALFISGAMRADIVRHKGYHAAIKRLKADGRVKHAGIACHGPRGLHGDSLEKVLLAAVEDGRFDLMLMLYNFLNNAEGNTVLAACKEKNIGAMAMKTAPSKISEIPDYDPDNPGKEYTERIKTYASFGMPMEQAIQLLKNDIITQKKAREDSKPFLAKYGLKTEEQLWAASIKWVRKNPDMHSVCVSMNNFDKVDNSVALSGKNLTVRQKAFLNDYENVLGWSYCRHGCTQCLEACERSLPVSTIMRYAYYYEQGHEKTAMEKYAALKDDNALNCVGCSAPCAGACPHGVMIQQNMFNVHSNLTLA